MDTVFKQVERNIDELAARNVDWSRCASEADILAAREGHVRLHFFREREIPAAWLPPLEQLRVLALAGAGGLQGPILAAAGAQVTVFDLSRAMLARDEAMARQYALPLRILHGNMTDLSMFPEGSFDLIINPPSMMYVPDVAPVFRECARVLCPGGTLLMAAPAPVNYLCDWDEAKKAYIACNRMPYSSAEHDGQGDWIEYGHTMESYLGGLTGAGFVITGYMEEQAEDITELMFAVKAIKPSRQVD